MEVLLVIDLQNARFAGKVVCDDAEGVFGRINWMWANLILADHPVRVCTTADLLAAMG